MPKDDGEDPAGPCAAQPDKESARAFLIAASIVAAIWLAAAATWVAGDTVVPWDSKNQFYAFFRFLADALHSGASPFWNPYHYGGHPSIADPQSLIFAPLFFALGAGRSGTVDPRLRSAGLRPPADRRHRHGGDRLAGALAAAGEHSRGRPVHAGRRRLGAAAAHRHHPELRPVSAGMADAAAGAAEALACSSRSCFAVSAATLALGRNQVALLLCYVLVAAAIAEIVTAEKPLRYLRERLPVLAVMALAGAALLAVPLLLTLQFAELSNRPGEPLDEALKGSIHPVNLATLAVANIFGTHGSYFGPNARLAARGRPHRRLVQLPVRRLAAASCC